MCGIVAVINSKASTNQLINSFNKLRKIKVHRGPDGVKTLHKKTIHCFLED